jgi:DNA-binding cell septation regulator SpoVG
LFEHQEGEKRRDGQLKDIAHEIDDTRDEIIRKLNAIWSTLGIRVMPIPTAVANSDPHTP